MKYVNYAHRGASSYAPENTLMAFYKGLELGANGIETDIQLSADGVPVLFHDDTLDRVTDRTGPLAELTATELQAVQVFCPDFPEKKDTICTFEEFLRHFGWRDLTFAIELKGRGTAAKTLALLKKYNMKDKVFITSFVWDNLAEAAALDPDWRYGFLAAVLHYILVTTVPNLHGGLCLYNGGLTAALVCLILVPELEKFFKTKKERLEAKVK